MQCQRMKPVNVEKDTAFRLVIEENASVVDVFNHFDQGQMLKVEHHVWLWAGNEQGLAVFIDDQTRTKKVVWIEHALSKFTPVPSQPER